MGERIDPGARVIVVSGTDLPREEVIRRLVAEHEPDIVIIDGEVKNRTGVVVSLDEIGRQMGEVFHDPCEIEIRRLSDIPAVREKRQWDHSSSPKASYRASRSRRNG